MELKIAISSVLLIVFIVFPGIIIRRAYYAKYFTKQFQQGSFSDRIITTIFWGIFAQTITIYIYNNAIEEGAVVHFLQYISKLFNTGLENLEQNIISNDNLINFLIFIILSLSVPYSLGFLAHSFVRLLRLDLYIKTLRFSNYWHYYLKGEIVKTSEFDSPSKSILRNNGVKETYIDILVAGNEKTNLYSGKLFQYSISKDTNQLDNIFICKVKRHCKFKKEFVDIPGDYMHLSFSNVLNMNIKYFHKKYSRRKLVFQNIFVAGILLSFITFLIAPWILFKELDFFRKLFGIFTAELTLLFIATTFVNLLPSTKKEGKTSATLYNICLVITFLYTTLKIFKVI